MPQLAEAHEAKPSSPERSESPPQHEQILPKVSVVPKECTSFAVYGTLRPDCDSGAPWTKDFVATRTGCVSARVFGFTMWTKKQRSANYPFSVPSVDPTDSIFVKVVSFGNDWDAKLVEADSIEEYDPYNPQHSWYHRRIVQAHLVDDATGELTGATVSAVMYFIPALHHAPDIQYFLVPEGDWLKRESDFVIE